MLSLSISNPYRCLTWQLSAPKATFFLNALSNSAEKEVYTEKNKQNKTLKQNKTKQNKTKHKQNKKKSLQPLHRGLTAITGSNYIYCILLLPEHQVFLHIDMQYTAVFFSCKVCGLIGATNTIIDILVRSLHKARLLLVSCQHPDGSMHVMGPSFPLAILVVRNIVFMQCPAGGITEPH